MTLVLNTVRTEVLTSEAVEGYGWSVETTIKSTAGFDLDTLRALWVQFRKNDNRRMATLVETAVALKAEREAAHAEALEAHHAGTQACDGCSGDGVFRFPGGCFENGVWKGKTGQCFRCGGTGRQTIKDTRRNRFYDNNVRRVFA